jgi:hypothetical protein
MRIMNLPSFTGSPVIADPRLLYASRLAFGRTATAPTGMQLLGYMGWPNDLTERKAAIAQIHEWYEYGEIGPLPPRLRTIQQHWARVADIVHLHHDIAEDGHQEKRGGESVGKAIHLLSKVSERKGTGEAQLWKIWKAYKDVAHIVTASLIISADMRECHNCVPLDLTLQHFLPFHIAFLMPDLIVGIGKTIEAYGLQERDDAETLFDGETIWRIPADIGVTPLPLPSRALRPVDLKILRDRRAGNRGRHRRDETTPVL